MTSFSDTLTIGLVLVLLFGSIALYLYTCIQQSEQKISLLESILLDLKMSSEVKAYQELPVESFSSSNSLTPTAKGGNDVAPYAPFEDDVSNEAEELVHEQEVKEDETLPADEVIDIDDYKSAISDAVNQPSQVNYDSMTLKELQNLAKSRGITGVTKKGPLIEALKTSDRASTVTPGPISAVGSNSFLETSASVSDESA